MSLLEQGLLLAIDGLNVVRRCYEANPAPDSAQKAEGAIRSSLGSIRRAFDEHRPTHAVFAFDHGGLTWRHRLYEQYKSKRKPMPQELREALPGLYERLTGDGYCLLRVPDVEADDTLGAVVARAQARGVPTVVLTTDKDAVPLQSDKVRIRDHFKPEWRDAAWCEQKFGVPPALLPDLLALTGDSTDGIPGVSRVGDKTAARLLREHGSLEAVLAAAPAMKGALAQRLADEAGMARLSRQLVALKTDIDLGIGSWSALRVPH